MPDFLELASTSRWLIERALQETTTATSNDDDFTKLEYYNNNGGGGGVPDDSILNSMTYPDDDGKNHPGPFLSKSAEAELYMLATNFLLYVAMVIISIMVAKIYFPESLERAQIPESTPRNYNYHRRSKIPKSDDEFSSDEYDGRDYYDGYGDDDDDVDGAEINDDNEALYSDDDADFDDVHGNDWMPHEDKGGNNDDDDDDLVDSLLSETQPHGRTKVSILEFEQTQTSRTKVLQRLLFCSLMLNVTFVTWGALQERMLTRRYPRHTGDYFTYSYALVFTNRFWTLVMSGILLLYLKPRLSRTTVLYEYSFPSISNMLSSWCQYEALRYVSFPSAALFKSFKLAPVMLMGKILGNKTYPAYDYFVAFLIGIGIALFMTSTDNIEWGQNYLGGTDGSKWTGIMLLCLFLFFDSFTSQFQSRMFQRHVDLSMVELMFATSAYSTVLSAITLVHTHELSAALEFVYEHSEIHLHFFMFSICSTIGQLFIFYTIKNFGAVVFTLIMTTRILLTIALSCVLYGHHVSAVGVLGLMTVLGAVLYRIKRKAEGTQLIRWQGMEDDKGRELVQEWHAHLDM